MKIFGFVEAVDSLRPKARWSCQDDTLETLDWMDEKHTKPTQAERDAEIPQLQAEYDANQYQRDRQYPTWQEQMDMQYHDEIDGTTTWKDAVAKVKADNPKPE